MIDLHTDIGRTFARRHYFLRSKGPGSVTLNGGAPPIICSELLERQISCATNLILGTERLPVSPKAPKVL